MTINVNRNQIKLILFGIWVFEKNAARARQKLIQLALFKVPSIRSIQNFFRQFTNNKFEFVDKARPGRPVTVSTETNTEKLKSVIEIDDQMSLEQMANLTGLKKSSAWRMLKKIKCKKLRPIINPHELTDELKRERVEWCKNMIEFVENNREFIITEDETYLYFEQRSVNGKRWTFHNKPYPRAARVNKFTTKKRMYFIFFNHKGLVRIDYQPLNVAAASNHYEYQLRRMIRKCELQGIPSDKIILHDDNARIHTSLRTRNFQDSVGMNRLTHPRYSPDLAPNDFWLIRKLKKAMRGHFFQNQYKQYQFARHFLLSLPPEEYNKCFTVWIDRMKKCIEKGGEYFEWKERNLKTN